MNSPTITPLEEMKDHLRKSIAAHGYKDLLETIGSDILRMVSGTKVKRRFPGVPMIATGFERYTPDGLRAVLECLVEVVPEADSVQLREALAFWNEAEAEILADHNVTPDL